MNDRQDKKNQEVLLKEIDQLKRLVSQLEAENLDLKMTTAESIRSSERYRLICRDTDDLIAVTTFSFNPIYTYISPSHKKLMGYEPGELVGKPGFNFIHPKDRKYMLPLLKGYLKNKLQGLLGGEIRDVSERIEFRVLARDGTWHYLQSTVNIIKDELLFISRDVTEQRLLEDARHDLEERLRQSEKMEAIGALAGGVAHDLNNILSGIVSYPELLLMDLPLDSPQRELLLAIQNAGQRAAAIVTDLLALARRGVMSMKTLQLNTVISDYFQSPEYEKLITYHSKIHIERILGHNLHNINGSPVHLGKMVMNLVTNAAEAIPWEGKITVTTRDEHLDKPLRAYDCDIPPGNYVVLSVSDNGIGISPEDQKKIFLPFFSKKKMGRSGTGLGMTVVWGTISDHNGFIIIDSEKDVGTTIQIYFPGIHKYSENFKEDPLDQIEHFQGNGEIIMVIDDIQEQREIASMLLTQLGYIVYTATHVDEAFDLLGDQRADLFILDMIMENGPDGLDNFKRIIKRFPHTRVIITSGFSETDRVKEAQHLGVGQYIQKPYTLIQIAAAIKTELRK